MTTTIRTLTLRALTFGAGALAFAGVQGGAQASTLKVLYNFCTQANCADGSFPMAGLVRDAQGNLFGTTETGGTHDNGVVFKVSPKGKKWSYKVLHDFCYSCGDGAFPVAGLILDTEGNLYGTTMAAGPNNMRGTVFQLSPNADGSKWTERILHVFTGTPDGDEPRTRLTYAGAAGGALYDGVSPLYGNTSRGGLHGPGGVYELTQKNGRWRTKVIHSFCAEAGCTDGYSPEGDMTMDAGGNLYGTTTLGGANGNGTVYRVSPNAKRTKWTGSILYSFCSIADCSDGNVPQGPVTMDSKGRLFGTTTADAGEGGVVFEPVPKKGGWKEKVLHTFCTGDCKDGYLPVAGVTIDPVGNLFGTNELGGPVSQGGTVFKLSGKTFSTVYNFCTLAGCADGSIPAAPLIMDETGNLYGTTMQGGPDSGAGTVFQLSP